MKLEEYLSEKLNVSLEEATKIANVFHEYKKEYGHKEHHHFHEHNHKEHHHNNENASDEYCERCGNHCSLDNLQCERGKSLQEKKAISK